MIQIFIFQQFFGEENQATFTTPVKITKRIEAIKDDPDDDKFIECAKACGADYIVSGDKHLLKLKAYEGTKIINAAEFLSFYNKAKFRQ